jgi:hypothetical protein
MNNGKIIYVIHPRWQDSDDLHSEPGGELRGAGEEYAK